MHVIRWNLGSLNTIVKKGVSSADTLIGEFFDQFISSSESKLNSLRHHPTMSDEDMFLSQRETHPPKEAPVPTSQPLPSDVEYHWAVMFHFDIGNKEPFSMFLRSTFSEKDIPSAWFRYKLSNERRLMKNYIHALNGNYSVFCKVEKGKHLFIKRQLSTNQSWFIINYQRNGHFITGQLISIG